MFRTFTTFPSQGTVNRYQVKKSLKSHANSLSDAIRLCNDPQKKKIACGMCVAELILELRAKLPLLQFPLITSIDNLNWIRAFLYVNDMVLIARSPAQLQSMIDACQDWAERSRMRINHEKTEVMMFYETPSQRTTRFPSTFHNTTRLPLSQPPQGIDPQSRVLNYFL